MLYTFEPLIHNAIKLDDFELVSKMLQFDIWHFKDEYGKYPLHIAALSCHPNSTRILKDLIESNYFDVNITDIYLNTPLNCAVVQGDERKVSLLLENHADVDHINYHGKTALYFAYLHKRNSITQRLLAYGVSKNQLNKLYDYYPRAKLSRKSPISPMPQSMSKSSSTSFTRSMLEPTTQTSLFSYGSRSSCDKLSPLPIHVVPPTTPPLSSPSSSSIKTLTKSSSMKPLCRSSSSLSSSSTSLRLSPVLQFPSQSPIPELESLSLASPLPSPSPSPLPDSSDSSDTSDSSDSSDSSRSGSPINDDDDSNNDELVHVEQASLIEMACHTILERDKLIINYLKFGAFFYYDNVLIKTFFEYSFTNHDVSVQTMLALILAKSYPNEIDDILKINEYKKGTMYLNELKALRNIPLLWSRRDVDMDKTSNSIRNTWLYFLTCNEYDAAKIITYIKSTDIDITTIMEPFPCYTNHFYKKIFSIGNDRIFVIDTFWQLYTEFSVPNAFLRSDDEWLKISVTHNNGIVSIINSLSMETLTRYIKSMLTEIEVKDCPYSNKNQQMNKRNLIGFDYPDI